MIANQNSAQLQKQLITALAFSPRNDYCLIATKKDVSLRLFRIVQLQDINSWIQLDAFKQKEHTQMISDVHWACDNKILTVSHDRSVVVWRQISETRWQKMHVGIYLSLSILTAKWAPSGVKFGIGSACNSFALSFYDTDENTWTVLQGKEIFKSAVITLSFHPSSNIVAVGSTDYSFKILTCDLSKSKNTKAASSNNIARNYEGPFKQVDSCMEVIYSVQNLNGWINHISFEQNGNSLLVIPHGGHVKVYKIVEKDIIAGEDDIRWKNLPFLSGYITRNGELLAGGFDRKVACFSREGPSFRFKQFLTKNEKSAVERKQKGMVAQLKIGIERGGFLPKIPLEDHLNSIKLTSVAGIPVSYDPNGIIHFWQ